MRITCKFFLFSFLISLSLFTFAKPTFAKVKVGQGYFVACSTSNCTNTVNLGFQPKAIFFYWTNNTALGFAANGDAGWGFAASTTASTPVQRAVAVADADAQTSSQTDRIKSDSYSIINLAANGSSAILRQEATTTFTTTGFSVAWRTVNTQTAYVIHYYALGGGDIVSTDAGTVNITTGTGSLAYSSLSFKPDILIFAWTFTEAVNTQTAGMEIGLGMATSSSARAAILNVASDAATANTGKRWWQTSTSTIVAASIAVPPVQDATVDFTSLDTNGFTLNKTDGPAAQLPVFFMAIKGGKEGFKAFSRPTVTGNSATTSSGFQPRGLFLFSASSTNNGALNSAGGMSLGSGTTTASSTAIWYQNFNVDSSDDNMHATSSLIAVELDRSSTINAQASLVSLDATGYTLNWKKVTTQPVQWFSWTIGDLAVLPAPVTDTPPLDGSFNDSVTLTGHMDDYDATTRGFAYGTSANLTGSDTSTTTETGSFGDETFTFPLFNLPPDNLYYYRAYATNSVGTGYGNIFGPFRASPRDLSTPRRMRLFQGYKLKIQKGGKIIIRQN